jgi:hypothetical protein
MTDQKDTLDEARSALQSMLAGVSCTPMEKEFFIRGFFLGKYSDSLQGVGKPVCKTDSATIDLFR